jgi:hypothetical protein
MRADCRIDALIGDRAYKGKKPITTNFLDFSSPDSRERACAREVELNRRLAPDSYLGVVHLSDPSSRPDEPVVVMRREREGFAPRHAARPTRRQPHRAGHRWRQLRPVCASQDGEPHGQVRRPAQGQSGLWATRNSGHTTGPHLHPEVMDFPDQLRADGLPFVSKTFRVDSRLVSQAALESLLFQTGGPAPLQPRFHRQLPTRRHSVAPRRHELSDRYTVNLPVAQGDSGNNASRLLMPFGNPLFVCPAASSERGKGVHIPTLLAERLRRL